jgi:hypothetical protein
MPGGPRTLRGVFRPGYWSGHAPVSNSAFTPQGEVNILRAEWATPGTSQSR